MQESSAERPETHCAVTRQDLRQRMLAARAALAAETVARWSAAICAQLVARFPTAPGKLAGFCWPIQNEPDVRAALRAWGIPLALPVVTAADRPLAFRGWTPETELFPDRYGIPTPASGDWLQPDVLLIPLLAFDAAGFRLGYGGGFFDRTLAALAPPPLAIGVGFECNRVARLPVAAHDLPMDWIVTEAGSWRGGGG
ncbi:MAG: 5-formyltetrahydrofolate cyclo-ligase [Zoogloeaceae bacterium]|nr:5-formyltetrahydrofolate cyclo-ligase [Zoogloeaceae bacterium]